VCLLLPSRRRKISGTSLPVLAEAIRHYGAPEALVTDGGAIFYSNQAIQLYDLLGIRKERIDPGAPWQDYAETLFSIMWN
jgi:putative transposase